MTFHPGEHIAWRCRVRDVDRHDEVSFVVASRVIADTPDEVITLRRPGDEVRRRVTERRGPAAHRHLLVTSWADAWTADTWKLFRVLVFKRKAEPHAISVFWQEGSDEVAFWYIDLVSPLHRSPAGYDFVENGLDLVVEPDLRAWKWKDEDELAYAIEQGVYTRAEADGLYAEGLRALERLRAERAVFERWAAWRPDPAWPPATLPAGWDAP